MAKARTSTKSKTKAELLLEAVADAVGAGKELHLDSVDFSDPNRPKTCLEVDFPILPLNAVASLEASSGAATKPIYQMSKWWARRPSSVFRTLLIALATKAPENQSESAKLIWNSYYANHQNNDAFRKLKVADLFMGGGTTIVEGSRLGMQMYGNDLNPVAWFIVRNEITPVESEDVERLLEEVKAIVRPQVMPFYSCDCPRGHKGKWTQKSTKKLMGPDFDPFSLTPEARLDYEYDGPEIIFTFWAKHGPCRSTGCNHRTPIISNPTVAVKTLTVKAWTDKKCRACGKSFDIEQFDARLAPGSMFWIAESEVPYAVMDEAGNYACPHCQHSIQDQKAAYDGESSSLGKSKPKKIDLTVLVHPNWLLGSPGHLSNGSRLGGRVDDDIESTADWFLERANTLALIEVRGKVPERIVCPDTGVLLNLQTGTVPKKSTFTCMESTCGAQWDILEAVKATNTSGPTAPYAIQTYCRECDEAGSPAGGRYFSAATNSNQFIAAAFEWESRKSTDLSGFWPLEKLYPYERGNTSMLYNQPGHGVTHWWMMFNPRQLLIHALLLKTLSEIKSKQATKDFVYGGLLQYLRYNCTNTIWHISNNQISAFFSNNNYQVRSTHVETSAYSPVGDGSLSSALRGINKGLDWLNDPWELVSVEQLSAHIPSDYKITGKSVKAFCNDRILAGSKLDCSSSTNLSNLSDCEFDCVVTDPPFGDLLHYADMADFFYVWLRIWAKDRFPKIFEAENTPRSLEVIANRALEQNPDQFYKRLLTACWREAFRVLKPGGVLVFTFHHSEDEPWIAVLESLFDAGFYLEAAYPIRSDETKGEGAKPGTFGSQQIEFDIVHVCRKRLDEPAPISWAKLRRLIAKDVLQLQEILEHHQKEGLGEADLQVIRRGKALEYYSRHYGKVYIERGREDEFSVKDALVGINQLLDDENDSSTERPPETGEPYTRQFLRLFADKATLDRDQIQKYLRGTGVSPSEFVDRGWCTEEKKIFTIADPLAWAQDWKGKSRRSMARDFDQAYFLIGASYENSGIKVSDTLSNEGFVPHPALGELLTWFVKHSPTEDMRAAAKRAQQLYSAWQAKNTKVAVIQRTLFDLEE